MLVKGYVYYCVIPVLSLSFLVLSIYGVMLFGIGLEPLCGLVMHHCYRVWH